MTDFQVAYKAVQDAIVGLGWSSNEGFVIAGTGFVINTDGRHAIVLTNEHVIIGLREIAQQYGGMKAIIFRNTTTKDENGDDVPFTQIASLPVPYLGLLSDEQPPPNVPAIPGFETQATQSYPKPDLGMVIFECPGIEFPTVSIDLDLCPDEGLPVGILGYPGGLSHTFSRPLENLQCGPILQTGVLSAVVPNRASPHQSYLAHIYSSRGCSGSPLFDAEGRILGVVYGIRPEEIFDGDTPSSDSTGFSSLLAAVPLTELPESFQGILRSGDFSELYAMISNTNGTNQGSSPQ